MMMIMESILLRDQLKDERYDSTKIGNLREYTSKIIIFRLIMTHPFILQRCNPPVIITVTILFMMEDESDY